MQLPDERVSFRDGGSSIRSASRLWVLVKDLFNIMLDLEALEKGMYDWKPGEKESALTDYMLRAERWLKEARTILLGNKKEPK